MTYSTGYNFVEIDLANAPVGIQEATSTSEASRMRLHRDQPSGYVMLQIVSHNGVYKSNNLPWMALTPVSLSIGGVATSWPTAADSPIAMIDTGGTQPYLSDPNGSTTAAMSSSVVGSVPDWVRDAGAPSTSCNATSSVVGIELGDGTNSYKYVLDLAALPVGERATSLVVCSNCGYMFGQSGMNIGGLSMLFNSLLIDISSKKIGLMKKSPN